MGIEVGETIPRIEGAKEWWIIKYNTCIGILVSLPIQSQRITSNVWKQAL